MMNHPGAAPPARPTARFDDLVAGTALAFRSEVDVLCATRADEVAPVLEAVERRTAAGEWAYGYVAYEAAAALAPELRTHDPVDGLPLAWFACGPPPETVPAVAAGDGGHGDGGHGPATGAWTLAGGEADHRAAVDRVRDRIAAGDTYQVNLTTRLVAPLVGDPFALYVDLAAGQRARDSAWIDTGRFAVAGASPELFFELTGDHVRMRPMKGTAPRGDTPDEDRALARRLVASEKERAENVMIVDLVRNDLGRIAATGSVRVTDLCRVERYPTVQQLTSTVTARLRPGTGLVDVFAALFPCGSVTGAPKARTTELITALETGPRGVYCGAVGIVAPPGSAFRARFTVAIRTALVDRATGLVTYGVGSGITWPSDAAEEYREMLVKARVLGPGATARRPWS